MGLPISGPLSTNLIADEVGYTQSIRHNLAGNSTPSQSPQNSLTHFYRPGNVATSGVTQSKPFGINPFHGQEAIYKCVTFTPTSGTGTAQIVSYYKVSQTISFTYSVSYCIRQNWDGNMAIKNVTNATYFVGNICSSFTGQSIPSPNVNYGQEGVRIFSVGGYNQNGDVISLDLDLKTPVFGGTFSNMWWSNPNSQIDQGRLNNTGLWNDTDVPYPGTSPIQFIGNGSLTFTINSPSTRIYYVGVGADNGITLTVDGVTQFSQNSSGSTDWQFKYWNIYPITFSAGLRTLKVINTNSGSVGSLGIDVYGNSLSSLENILQSATATSATPSNIDLIYSSSNYRYSGIFYQDLNSVCPTTTTTTSTTTTTTTIPPSIVTVYAKTQTSVTISAVSFYYKVNGGAWTLLVTANVTNNGYSTIGNINVNSGDVVIIGATDTHANDIQFGTGNGGSYAGFCGISSPYTVGTITGTVLAYMNFATNAFAGSNAYVLC